MFDSLGSSRTEWLTPHTRTLNTGSLPRKTSTFCCTKCFFLVFLLGASALKGLEEAPGEDMVPHRESDPSVREQLSVSLRVVQSKICKVAWSLCSRCGSADRLLARRIKQVPSCTASDKIKLMASFNLTGFCKWSSHCCFLKRFTEVEVLIQHWLQIYLSKSPSLLHYFKYVYKSEK